MATTTPAQTTHLTQPEDVLQAHKKLVSIGHFSVAASFGNARRLQARQRCSFDLDPKNSQALIEKEFKTEAEARLTSCSTAGSGSEKERSARPSAIASSR